MADIAARRYWTRLLDLDPLMRQTQTDHRCELESTAFAMQAKKFT